MPDKDLFRKADPDDIPHILDSVHRKYSRQDFYRDLHNVKLQTVPGTVSRHCNTAAQLLGYIMEGVYNDCYEKPFENVFLRNAQNEKYILAKIRRDTFKNDKRL